MEDALLVPIADRDAKVGRENWGMGDEKGCGILMIVHAIHAGSHCTMRHTSHLYKPRNQGFTGAGKEEGGMGDNFLHGV